LVKEPGAVIDRKIFLSVIFLSMLAFVWLLAEPGLRNMSLFGVWGLIPVLNWMGGQGGDLGMVFCSAVRGV
jgi:hypothetical protein